MSSLETGRSQSSLVGAVALLIAVCAAVPFSAPAADVANDEASRFVQERFQKQDTNGDGKLSPEEVGSRRLFNRMDADGDGFVTRAEAKTFFSNVATTLQERFGQRIGGGGDTNSAPAAEDTTREGPHALKASEHGVGTLAPDVTFTDLDGKQWRLSDFKKNKALVVVMTSTSCPLSKKYAPALARLEKKYREKGVAFIFVNAVSSDTKEDMRAAVKTHGFTGPYVRDAEGAVANALGAVVTTDVLVFDSARTLVYHGAVDDQYGLAYALEASRRRYLEDALGAVLAGRAPTIAATTAPGCALDLSQAKASAPTAPVTYHNRISRIVQNHCTECHHKGGVGPFALDSYEDLVGHAGMIRKQVERGAMPPWFAAPTAAGEHTIWANDRSLATRDKKDLLAWLDQGRPVGNSADAPLPRDYPTEWEIGQPDAILQIPTPISVKAEGTMPYQNVTVETTFTEDKWVRGIEVRPTARQVVHHVLVFARGPADPEDKSGRRRDGEEERGGFFAVYVPGNHKLIYPDGFAKLLPAGARLRFQIHYTPNGTATNDQVRLGMLFAKEPPTHVVRVIGLVNPLISIPPGADNHEEQAGIPILKEARVLAFMPHMHVRGKAFRYEAIYADDTKKTLLDVPRYDFNWQLAYRYAEPLTLPRGARLRATGWYDNSANNPANPDPNKTVRWGPQTADEMMLGYVEYYFPDEKPKAMANR